jgi:cytochrome c-type biogenesis protein CcmH
MATTIVLLAALAAHAQPADDAVLDQRTAAVARELRCLVCQNQTIEDSQAELAVDLRRQVRAMLRAGRSEREIVDFMTRRYGDFVAYRPPLRTSTLLLWFGPVLLLLAGATVLVRRIRGQPPVPPLPRAERERAARLLSDTGDVP